MKEFEDILDQAEKSLQNPEELFGFVLIGHNYMPNAKIAELLMLKDVFDSQQQSGLPYTVGSSRAERRALDRKNQKKSLNSKNSQKRKKKRK